MITFWKILYFYQNLNNHQFLPKFENLQFSPKFEKVLFFKIFEKSSIFTKIFFLYQNLKNLQFSPKFKRFCFSNQFLQKSYFSSILPKFENSSILQNFEQILQNLHFLHKIWKVFNFDWILQKSSNLGPDRLCLLSK